MELSLKKFTTTYTQVLQTIGKYLLHVNLNERPFSKKAVLILKAISSLQILTLLVPMGSAYGLPWNYSNMQWMWIAMHGVVRPDSVGTILFQSQIPILSFFGSFCILYFALLAIFVLKIRTLVNSEESFNGKGNSSSSDQSIAKFQQSLRIVVGDLLQIPILSHSISSLTHLNKTYADEVEISNYFCLIILIFIPILILHHYCFVRIRWNDGYNSISSPFMRAWESLYISGLCVICASIDYNKQPLLYSLLLMGFSCLYMISFCSRRPYFKSQLNYICLAQGVMVLYCGIILCLSQLYSLNDQNQSFATLVFFLPLSPILYLSKYYLQHLDEKSSEVTLIKKAYDLEFFLKQDVKMRLNDSDEVVENGLIIDHIKKAMKLFKDDTIVTIWILNFYIITDKRVLAKALLALLMKFQDNLLYVSHVYYTRHYVMNWLCQFPEEQVAYSFIKYKERLEEMLKKDEVTCRVCFSLYEELGRKQPNFRKLERLAVSLAKKMKDCKLTYKKVIGAHGNYPTLIEWFAGYLENIENNPKHKAYTRKAYEARDERDRINRSKNEDFSYLDMENTLLIVSLEHSNYGIITWGHNTENLGYSKLELIDGKISQLLEKSLEGSF